MLEQKAHVATSMPRVLLLPITVLTAENHEHFNLSPASTSCGCVVVPRSSPH